MDLIQQNNNKVCAVCQSKATQICGGCGDVSYCNRDHQREHWSTHKLQCKPYKILTDPKLGRYMAAAKNLKAGDIIFRERALAVGPKQGCLPVCLTCYAGFPEAGSNEPVYRCPGCNFPFCGEACVKNRVHEAECAILSRAKSKITISDFTKAHPVYECITPLRNLLLKTNQPEQYEVFRNLQHHNDQRRGGDLWRVNQINVVEFLRGACSLATQFEEEEIHAACGVMDVNAFEIRLPVSGQRVVGVFPTAAMMAHHCISNMSHVIDSGYRMTVRASVPIQRGEPIFMSYAHSLEGTKERRALLRFSKFFECDCSRCADPTESSTYLSAFKCQKCPFGRVLPVNPLKESETEWRCDQLICNYTLTANNISKAINKLKEEFDAIGSNEVDQFEGFLHRHEGLLHTNHYLFTSARHSLSQLYGRDDRFLLNTLSPELLERKIAICRQLLDVTNVVEPGLTRIRGVTLYEMHAPILLLARRHFETGQWTSQQLKEKVKEVQLILMEAKSILSLEDSSSPEGVMGTAAAQALNQIQSWIASL